MANSTQNVPVLDAQIQPEPHFSSDSEPEIVEVRPSSPNSEPAAIAAANPAFAAENIDEILIQDPVTKEWNCSRGFSEADWNQAYAAWVQLADSILKKYAINSNPPLG